MNFWYVNAFTSDNAEILSGNDLFTDNNLYIFTAMPPSNQMQPHHMQPNLQQQQQQQQQQPGNMSQFQTMQQQAQQQQQSQQNSVPQPVAPPPNTMTSQFQANMQPQITPMSSSGLGPVPPPNAQFTSMAAPVPPPQWSSAQAISQINTNATQSQTPAMGMFTELFLFLL